MILLDVNVLVYAHREDAPNHSAYREWLEAHLNSSTPCGVSDLVLAGCLRVVTHPKVFDPPTPLAQATLYIEQLRTHRSVRIVNPGPAHWQIFLQLCRRIQAKGNLIPDAYHAALAMESGCEWVTTDRGFARFPGLRWRHPLDH
ncbi:MAG TPA: type II toxin-antitoxin system VapC family toxin [Candidatus Paceibacterota bacterium]|nr:type II toxin-antitoxin system VapC family toxin [Verrucomicrobiota bacterium]HRY50884.1 type II toxin-antitoxin system VapC family toxin [Candidatus Paceibacterota bacterium]